MTQAAELGLPLIEDNPYGDLWFDQAPPAPLTSRNPEGCIYLGSFSKRCWHRACAHGLHRGPGPSTPSCCRNETQAADLHSPGFNQRMITEGDAGRLSGSPHPHHPRPVQEPARRHAGGPAKTCPPTSPGTRLMAACSLNGRLPEGMDAQALLPAAVDKGVAWPLCPVRPSTTTMATPHHAPVLRHP